MSLYNAALDIGSWPFFYRIKRWQTAIGLSVIVFGLTYLLVVATNFLANLEAFVTIMVVTATPWMVIVGIDFLQKERAATRPSSCTHSPCQAGAGGTGSSAASIPSRLSPGPSASGSG